MDIALLDGKERMTSEESFKKIHYYRVPDKYSPEGIIEFEHFLTSGEDEPSICRKIYFNAFSHNFGCKIETFSENGNTSEPTCFMSYEAEAVCAMLKELGWCEYDE